MEGLPLFSIDDDLEWPVFRVLLDIVVYAAAANQPLRIKDRVLRLEWKALFALSPTSVKGATFRQINLQSFLIGSADPGRSDAVALIVGDDFHLTVFSGTLEKNEYHSLACEIETYSTQA